MHETKVFTNVSLKYFETQAKASAKQLKWHDTLTLLDMELIHKQGRDNIIMTPSLRLATKRKACKGVGQE
jgi:hypothetical protein